MTTAVAIQVVGLSTYAYLPIPRRISHDDAAFISFYLVLVQQSPGIWYVVGSRPAALPTLTQAHNVYFATPLPLLCAYEIPSGTTAVGYEYLFFVRRMIAHKRAKQKRRGHSRSRARDYDVNGITFGTPEGNVCVEIDG